MENNDAIIEHKWSNESDAISLFCDGDSLISDSDVSRKISSLSSLEEYSIDAKRSTGHDISEMSNWSDQKAAYDKKFEGMKREKVFSEALKQLVDIIRQSPGYSDNKTDYIAKKIFSPENDNIGAFHDDIKLICAQGYTFNAAMINKLMNHCSVDFNVHFHQFVLTNIIKRMDSLDDLNEGILQRFVSRRLANVQSNRIGLSRRIA